MQIIYPQFLKNIRHFNLISPHTTIIAALSGGKDSVTLIHLLKELQKDITFHPVAAYFNHRIRNDHQEEQRWVEDFCQSMHIDLICEKGTVTRFKAENKLNLEHAASLQRYAFLKSMADRFPRGKIATGHTQSDLTETFLMKLLRGSGSRGLSSIYTRKDSHIIRPMLVFTRQDILQFLQRNRISWYEDYTNADNTFIRNHIRNIVIPEIQKMEPHLDEHIARTAALLQDEYDYFSEQGQEFLRKNLLLDKILPRKKMKNRHVALQRFIFREYIKRLKGNLLDIDFPHVEKLMGNHSDQRDCHIPGLALKLRKDFLFPNDLSLPDYCYSIQSPGSISIKEIRKKIRITMVDSFKKPRNNYEIITDPLSIRFPLQIRNPQKVDKYMKHNSTILQRVFEVIRASGIPSELRNLCPVVVNGDGSVLWVVGSPISHLFQVKDTGRKKFIRISFGD